MPMGQTSFPMGHTPYVMPHGPYVLAWAPSLGPQIAWAMCPMAYVLSHGPWPPLLDYLMLY